MSEPRHHHLCASQPWPDPGPDAEGGTYDERGRYRGPCDCGAGRQPASEPASEQTPPSYAQRADWWLCGQLLADPKDLLRGLLDEHRDALAAARGDAA